MDSWGDGEALSDLGPNAASLNSARDPTNTLKPVHLRNLYIETILNTRTSNHGLNNPQMLFNALGTEGVFFRALIGSYDPRSAWAEKPCDSIQPRVDSELFEALVACAGILESQVAP